MSDFRKTTWSNVKPGDVALTAWSSPRRIVEVEITRCVTEPGLDGELLVIAQFDFDRLHYGQAFDSDEVVYVQSRP